MVRIEDGGDDQAGKGPQSGNNSAPMLFPIQFPQMMNHLNGGMNMAGRFGPYGPVDLLGAGGMLPGEGFLARRVRHLVAQLSEYVIIA